MVKKKEKCKYNILLKGCVWYKGKSGMPDVSKCKQCFYSLTCLGRNYMKWKNLNLKAELRSKDSCCLAAAAKEKAELIRKILSEKDIEKILLSQFNIEIIEADFNALINQKPPTTATEAVSFEYRKRAGRIKLKEMSNMIHSELMKRLKNE